MIKKIKSSLSTKVFLCISSLLLISSLFIYGIAMVVMPKTYKSQLAGQFTESFNKLIVQLEASTYEESSKIIYNFCILNHAYVTIESKNIKSNYGSFENKTNSSGSINSNSSNMTLSAMTKVKFKNSSDIYILQAAASQQPANQITALFMKLLPWIILLIMFISFLGAYLCTWLLARPIVKISGISKKMSALDMTWRCEINRSDEIGVLAASLNNMAKNLDNALTDLKNANEKLQLDIQRERRQEKQRRAFFAAVSHELKTPITILRGQLESMLCNIGIYKDRDKYLQESLKTTENMEKLVKEILMVSKMGADNFKLKLDCANISNLVEDCCKEVEPLIKDKELVFDIWIQEKIISLINEKLFKKAVSNIIMNAIKYSPKGDNISVRLSGSNPQAILTVENYGVSIDDRDIDQLFVPFYRVESSHNSSTGGSGLGLYIVKTILDLHKMNYNIENIAHGVRFTIKFNMK